jgi:hypothetical protein
MLERNFLVNALSFRKPLLGLASVAMIGMLLLPAAARGDSYQRTRSGISLWVPQGGSVNARYVDALFNKLEWTFGWGDWNHFFEANGRHRAFEVKASTDANYAAQYGTYFSSNIPSGARPYRDTQQSDTSCCAFGVGMADANYMTANYTYDAVVDVYKPTTGPGDHQITWTMRAASRLDHDRPCTAGDTFCAFTDYSYVAVRGRDFSVIQAQNVTVQWSQNKLYNQSLEDFTAYNFASPSPTASHATYCNKSGFQSNCFVEWNTGTASSWASIWQDTTFPTVRAGDNYTLEAMLRCPGNPSNIYCTSVLRYWGEPNNDELRSANVTLPDDGLWYLCRLDIEHGEGGIGLARNHAGIRFEVYNTTINGVNLDMDYTTMANPVDRITSTTGDPVAPPSAGGACTPALLYA